MNIYQYIDKIDEFEERHGADETLRRAKRFMFEYLMGTKQPMSDTVVSAMGVACNNLQNIDRNDEETKKAEDTIWAVLRDNGKAALFGDPEYSIYHAAFGPLSTFENLKPGESISERVSNFLEARNAFEQDDVLAIALIDKLFAQ
jgi:hypothetical protein